MKKQYLIVSLIILSILFSSTGFLESRNSSDTGMPKDIDDLYNLSSLIVRGSFVDLECDSDLVAIHVTEAYKGECDEYVSIRRLEIQNLAPLDNNDCIIFLNSLGKINTLTWGTCNVFHIEEDCVFNNVELHKDSESPFSVDGMILSEFITKYLEK